MRCLAIACVLVLCVGLEVGAQRCKRSIQHCITTDRGFPEFQRYDTCTEICCGLRLWERDVYLECCGNTQFGRPYNTQTEVCCFFNGEVGIHNKTEGAVCCGTGLINPTADSHIACCVGPNNNFTVIDTRTQMCCMGVPQTVADTAYTSCCGDTAYDRRTSSCICEDDVVTVGVPEHLALCCIGRRGEKKAYNRNTQRCCDGEPYSIDNQFCCGRSIGNIMNETCCRNSVVVGKDPSIPQDFVGCCRLTDGSLQAYDIRVSVCCGGEVLPRDLNAEQICCGGVLYYTAVNGSACCNGQPYFPALSICCSGALGVGDRCCGSIPYDSTTQVCCNGEVEIGDSCCAGVPFSSKDGLVCCNGIITDGDMCCDGVGYFYFIQFCCGGIVINRTGGVLGCCVDEPFNVFTHTCCGVTVFDNPVVDGPSGPEVSTHTRCCGDFANDNTLRPYDYLTQICCDGVIVDLDGALYTNAICCGDGVVNPVDELCCNNNVTDNPYGSAGACCDGVVIDTRETLCCSGVPRNNSIYACCGDSFISIELQICCGGVPVPVGDIPPAVAVCCGSIAIDSNTQLCCAGQPQTPAGDIAGFRCCGSGVINPETQLCCAGQPQTPGNITGLECCGTVSYNPTLQKCCDGVPRDLNGILPENAICCGDGCIDGEVYWCCRGRQYMKGSIDGEEIVNLDCRDATTGAVLEGSA